MRSEPERMPSSSDLRLFTPLSDCISCKATTKSPIRLQDGVAKDLDEVPFGDVVQTVVSDELVHPVHGCIDQSGVTTSDGIPDIDLLTTNADLPVTAEVRLHVGGIGNLCLQQ